MTISTGWYIADFIIAAVLAIIIFFVLMTHALVSMGDVWSWKAEWVSLQQEVKDAQEKTKQDFLRYVEAILHYLRGW